MSKNLFYIAVAASVALAGCGGGPEASHPLPDWPEDVPPLDDLLLEPETVEQTYDELPEDMVDESGLRVAEQGLVGDRAILLPHLRAGLLISNAMARTGLTLLHTVARTGPPTTANRNKLVWEIGEGDARYTLIIERDAEDDVRWNYQLLVRPAAGRGDGVPRLLLGGWFRPEGRVNGRQTGSGLIRYDYDAFATLPQADEPVRGIGAFGFRTNPGGGLRMQVILEGFKPRDSDERLDARYVYRLAPDGGGEFRFLLKTEILPGFEGDEVLGETVVWGPSRAAKAKALVVNPNVETQLRIDECWGRAGRQVWVQYDPAEVAESDGDENDCEGPLADLELDDPDLGPVEPGTLPEVPPDD